LTRGCEMNFILPLLQFIPSLVHGVESLVGHNSQPLSGEQKLQTVVQMVMTGLTAAGVVLPNEVGDKEKQLVTDVTNDVVAYFNAKGIFNHGLPQGQTGHVRETDEVQHA